MPTNPMLDSAKKLIASADLLRDSADKMAARRKEDLINGLINLEQFRSNVMREMVLRNDIDEIVAKSISAVIDGVNGEQSELETAIQEANNKIKNLEKFQHVLKVFTSLIGLADAIALGKPLAIINALKSVVTTTKAV